MSDPRKAYSERDLLFEVTEYVIALTFDRPQPTIAFDRKDRFAAFKEASAIHGVGPLLGLRTEAGSIAPPEPVGTWLVGQIARNRERLARMREELLETLAALDERGLRAMPLKGGAMLLESVAAVEWRSFADLDVLVPEAAERIQEVDLALAHVGYCLDSVSWKHRSYTTCAPGPPLVIGDGEHPDNPRDVEVHTALVEMFRGFDWDLTPYLLHAPSERAGWPVPSEPAMALHLAVHASISVLEGTARAINLIDLARAAGRVGATPLYLAVRDAGLKQHARFVYPAIALTARETGDAACVELQRRLAPWVTSRMAEWADTVALFHVSWAGRHDRPAFDRHELWARSRTDRARMLAHTLLPAPAILASEHGAGSGPLAVARGYGRHYRRLARRLIDT